MLKLIYDKYLANGSIRFSQGAKLESGQMVLKQVKGTYFDAVYFTFQGILSILFIHVIFFGWNDELGGPNSKTLMNW